MEMKTSTLKGDMVSPRRAPRAEITGVSGAMVKRISEKRLGEVPFSLGRYWNNRPVLADYFAISGKTHTWETRGLQP